MVREWVWEGECESEGENKFGKLGILNVTQPTALEILTGRVKMMREIIQSERAICGMSGELDF